MPFLVPWTNVLAAAPAPGGSGVTVRVWSDYVCPFCYVGYAIVKRLKTEFPDVDVTWRAFELHPSTPSEGAPLASVLPPGYADAARANVRRVADAHGVTDMTVPDFISNSRVAHAVTEVAETRGFGDAFRDAVMRAYWRDGRNVGDVDVLRDAWRDAGGGDAFPEEAVDAARDFRAEAHAAGVSGVPTFDVIGSRLKRRVVGAQPFDVIRRVVDEVVQAEESP